jgi:hypothetical protein
MRMDVGRLLRERPVAKDVHRRWTRARRELFPERWRIGRLGRNAGAGGRKFNETMAETHLIFTGVVPLYSAVLPSAWP